jgi:hypothetical protein
MAVIPSMLASPGKKEQPDLCIGLTQLAATVGRSIIASLVMEFEILSVFTSHLVFSHETGMEQGWRQFHQCWHLPATKSSCTGQIREQQCSLDCQQQSLLAMKLANNNQDDIVKCMLDHKCLRKRSQNQGYELPTSDFFTAS